MITAIGKQRLASAAASGSTFISHIGVGDDDTDEDVSDLVLGNELYRVALTTVAQNDQTCWGVGTILASAIGAGSYDINEFGFFDALSGGNMICRVVLGETITITGTKELVIVWGEVNP